MLVCISSPEGFCCSSRWCVDTEEEKEETLGHRASPIMVGGDVSTNILLEPFSITIACVHPDMAGKRVGEHNYWAILMVLAWGRWINTSNSYINSWYDYFGNRKYCKLSVPDRCLKRRELRCYREDPNVEGVHTPVMLPQLSIKYCCQMGKCSDAIQKPNPCLHHSSWPISQQNIRCTDTYRWLPHLPSSGWHSPNTSREYVNTYWEGIGRWCWYVSPNSKRLPNHHWWRRTVT